MPVSNNRNPGVVVFAWRSLLLYVAAFSRCLNVCVFVFPVADGKLYSATVADFNSRDPLVLESTHMVRTEQFDSKWLNGRHFVLHVIMITIPLSDLFLFAPTGV